MSHINRHNDYDDYWDDIEKQHKAHEEIHNKEFEDMPLGGFGFGLDILQERVNIKTLAARTEDED